MGHSSAGSMQTWLTTQHNQRDQEEDPIIDATASSMDNSTLNGQETRKVLSKTLKKIKAQRETIRLLLQRQLQRSNDALYDSHYR